MASIREMIRKEYEFLNILRSAVEELGADKEKIKNVVWKCRKRIADLERNIVDPLAKPITEEWRHGCREDGEGGWDYAIVPDEGETDKELSDWFDSCIAYPPINSPYDCSGKRFTWHKHIKRTPTGIVVIHRWSLDV